MEVAPARFLHEQQADDEGHQGDDHRVYRPLKMLPFCATMAKAMVGSKPPDHPLPM
jgi:hypothetical protein